VAPVEQRQRALHCKWKIVGSKLAAGGVASDLFSFSYFWFEKQKV